MIAGIGSKIIQALDQLGGMTQLFFKSIKLIATGQIHIRNTVDQMTRIGVESLPIVLITGMFVGMVFAVQIVKEFLNFGATTMIGGVMGMALWRELIPMLTGLVVAGRIGAAISAEIGTMKVTEQIEALVSMAQDPVRYLVVPRILALFLMTPLLVGLGDIIGFLAGFVIAIGSGQVNPMSYFHSADTMLTLNDIYGGLIKSALFGVAIAIISCHLGLNASSGAKGVGEVATKSVVYSFVSIFVLNYILSLAIY